MIEVGKTYIFEYDVPYKREDYSKLWDGLSGQKCVVTRLVGKCENGTLYSAKFPNGVILRVLEHELLEV